MPSFPGPFFVDTDHQHPGSGYEEREQDDDGDRSDIKPPAIPENKSDRTRNLCEITECAACKPRSPLRPSRIITLIGLLFTG